MIPKCDVGFLRRPERVVLFIIGALSTVPGSNNFLCESDAAVLWVLAIGFLLDICAPDVSHLEEVTKNEVGKAGRRRCAKPRMQTRTSGTSRAYP
jgi:hypothetical protein